MSWPGSRAQAAATPRRTFGVGLLAGGRPRQRVDERQVGGGQAGVRRGAARAALQAGGRPERRRAQRLRRRACSAIRGFTPGFQQGLQIMECTGRLLITGKLCAGPDILPCRQAAASCAWARASQRRALRGLAHGGVGRVARRIRRVSALLRADVLAERLQWNSLVYTPTFKSTLNVTGLTRARFLVPRRLLDTGGLDPCARKAAAKTGTACRVRLPTPRTAIARPVQPPLHDAWPHLTRHPTKPWLALHAKERRSLRSPGDVAGAAGGCRRWCAPAGRRHGRTCSRRPRAPAGPQPLARPPLPGAPGAASRPRGSKQGRLTGRRVGPLADMRKLRPASRVSAEW